MPDARLANTRATLPTGYQYGDAAKPQPPKVGEEGWAEYIHAHFVEPVRAMSADPVAYAAYRARVDAAQNSPAEIARATTFTNWAACSARIKNA